MCLICHRVACILYRVPFVDGVSCRPVIHVGVTTQHGRLHGTSQLRFSVPNSSSSPCIQSCSPPSIHHAGLRGFRRHSGQGDQSLLWVSGSILFVLPGTLLVYNSIIYFMCVCVCVCVCVVFFWFHTPTKWRIIAHFIFFVRFYY
jgi:hypothetical protein